MTIYSITEEEKQQLIDDVMEDFDFDKVHKAMVALEWKYINKSVPSKHELEKFARSLLESVMNGVPRFDTLNAGGFVVQFDPFSYILTMDFHISSAYAQLSK